LPRAQACPSLPRTRLQDPKPKSKEACHGCGALFLLRKVPVQPREGT
jgi:hypothetical protein